MRLKILALTLTCIVLATGTEAKSTWIGPKLAFPVPARDIGDAQLGIDAGVTINDMKSPRVGVGLDLIYHYWPASPAYKAAFDRYLRNLRYQVIDSETWAFSALQATAHLKLVAPIIDQHGPWVEVGAGMYFVDRNIAEPNWDGSPVSVVSRGGSGITPVPGWYGSVGFDFHASSGVALGLNANYHHVWSEYKEVPNFSALTLGTHILFGW